MKRHAYLVLVFTNFILIACNPFSRSWDKIYEDQQLLFKTNRRYFELAVTFLNSSKADTTLPISDHYFKFPDSLVINLKKIGIATIEVSDQICETKNIQFIPDSLWDVDRFSVIYIGYDKCDERSKQGYHWKMEGTEHKHSFGQGGGWFIYSDSDHDPF